MTRHQELSVSHAWFKTGHLLFTSFACCWYCLLGNDRAVERGGSGDSTHKRWLQSSSAVSLAWNSQGLCDSGTCK